MQKKQTINGIIQKLGVALILVLAFVIVLKPVTTHNAVAENEPAQESGEDCGDVYNNVSGEIISTGPEATGRLVNHSGCSYTVSIAVYKQFVPDGPEWITSQILFDYTTLTLAPHQTIEADSLRANTPSCHYQIDLIEGEPIEPPDYGGPNHALFDADYGGGEYCGEHAENAAPILELQGEASISMCKNVTFTDPGATAYDDEDGDITNDIVRTGDVNTSTVGTYTLNYNVTDSGGRAADQVSRTVTVTNCGPVNQLPIGYLDGASCTHIGGWAKDMDSLDERVTVELYRDGEIGTGVLFTSVVANSTRIDVGDYAFGIDTPASLKDGAAHTIWAYGVDLQTGEKTLLTQSPKTITCTVLSNNPPAITLTGNSTISSCINVAFTDPGATATDTEDGNITSSIVKTGTVDHTTLGSYTLRYNVTDSDGAAATEVTRTVNIVSCTGNNDRPVITLTGASPFPVCLNTNFTDPGATATDTEDGNITSSIVKTGTVNTATTGNYILRYNVSDSQGLAAVEVTRTVAVNPCVGNTPPVITLTGTSPITISQCTNFTDPGATATDAQDGNLTSSITKTSTVVNGTPGSYTVTYNVTDSGGLSATSVVRNVTITAATCGGGGGGGGGPLTPTVLTNSCTNINNTSATLNGIADANGAASLGAWFEWGTDSSNLDNKTSQQNLGANSNNFSASISGLTPGTTYYYRGVAKNSNTTIQGNILTCKTSGGGGAVAPIQPTVVATASPQVVQTASTITRPTTTRVATVATTTPPKISLAAVPLQTVQCFAITDGKLPTTLTASSRNVITTPPASTTLSASALAAGEILPGTLFGWMILIILVLILTIIAQNLFTQMSREPRPVLEHAHH